MSPRGGRQATFGQLFLWADHKKTTNTVPCLCSSVRATVSGCSHSDTAWGAHGIFYFCKWRLVDNYFLWYQYLDSTTRFFTLSTTICMETAAWFFTISTTICTETAPCPCENVSDRIDVSKLEDLGLHLSPRGGRSGDFWTTFLYVGGPQNVPQ